METRQMSRFFFIYFFRFNFVIFISEFKNTENTFSCGSHFGSLWSVKYLIFGKSYQFKQLITLFEEVDTLRLLKIYLFCPPAVEPNTHFLGSSSWTKSSLNSELQ